MKILHLTLKKKWFYMILSGVKTEEYREIKPYWGSRLSEWDGNTFLYHKSFDIVRFRNGYSNTSPMFDIECKNIKVDFGKDEWGAIGLKKYYVITLGKILNESLGPQGN